MMLVKKEMLKPSKLQVSEQYRKIKWKLSDGSIEDAVAVGEFDEHGNPYGVIRAILKRGNLWEGYV